ncbi:hypothetical protein C8R47DRAFT_1047444 [Mycena vitilis]|nr:hypothetical protein C8R47DRAFT_1047444 [Mycena vitilis]
MTSTVISKLRKLLEDLDAQIVEQKGVLTELEQSRNAAERDLYAAAVATSPVLTLPVEITAEIFEHSLPPVDDSTWYRGRMLPLIVSYVCRAWRDIALATPKLWTTLRIPSNSTTDPGVVDPGHAEDLVDQWLARAGACPLSLILPALVPANRMREVINRYCDRVERLELCAESDIANLGLSSVVFPILQRVVLSTDEDVHDRVTVFSNAPRFHDLRAPRGFSPGNRSLPWLQLTRFEGKIWNLDLFTSAPNLIEVRCLFDCDPEDTDNLVATTHPTLRSLVLVDGSYDTIIDYLTLPALQHLDVIHMDTYYYLGPFLERSSPPLVSLSVRAHTGKAYQVWNNYLPRVAETLEILHIVRVSEEVVIDMFFPFGDRRLQASLKLSVLSLEDVDGGVNLYRLTQYLYSRSGKLCSFRLVWKHSPLMDRRCKAGLTRGTATQDTISSHFSQIARAGTEIYLGTADKNYAGHCCDEA